MLLNIKGNKRSWAARVMRVQEEISRESIRVTEKSANLGKGNAVEDGQMIRCRGGIGIFAGVKDIT